MGLEFIDVVRFRNHLDSLTVTDDLAITERWLEDLGQTITSSEIPLYGHSRRMPVQIQRAKQSVHAVVSHIDVIKKDLDTWIKREEGALLRFSENLYSGFQRTLPAQILERKLQADPRSESLFRERIKLYTDWRSPGLIFRPGLESHILDLVALDPLYVVDHAWHLIEPALSLFNEQYRARARPYTVLDTNSDITRDLPKSAFAFILAHNFFNYKPINLIDRYLKECIALLRPGGTMMMTYNDCDLAHGVGLVDSASACYTPGRIVRQLAVQAGFSITAEYHSDIDLVWLELQRPGELTSIRGAQTLAKIVERSK
jgi:SAM-dependent methyltransferase